MVGQNVGKYRVLDRVGRGGMGTVYRAVDDTLDREVAIKILNAELNEPEVARRFRAEAITVARLSHAGIATIYELFQHDDQWLMVMEFVRGETLEQIVAREGPLAPEQAAIVCMQVLSALAHAHHHGVVHRDLKPANIMRTETGDVKVMDFGIARVSGSEHLTTVGFMMGTPAYMAPEQVQGHEIDARTDLYAIGVVFYRLLTGQLPFKGDTPFAMAQAQVSAPPIPIETRRTDLPAWVTDVLTTALQKDPADRFQSAQAFFEALRSAVGGVSGTAAMGLGTDTGALTAPRAVPASDTLADTAVTPVPVPRVPAAPATGTRTTGVAAPTAPRPPSFGDAGVQDPGNRGRVIAAAAVAGLVVAGGLWWAMAGGREADPAPEASSTAMASEIHLPYAPPAPVVPPASRPAPVPAAAPAAGTGVGAGTTEPPAVPAPTDRVSGDAPSQENPSAGPDAVEIDNVRVLVLDGRRARDREATLNLGDDEFVAVATADGSTLASWPYDAVTAATYVHARNPRWDPALASPPDNLDVGGVFRSSRHYLTLQNARTFVILRLEDINVIRVIREIEARTGLTIPRTSAGN